MVGCAKIKTRCGALPKAVYDGGHLIVDDFHRVPQTCDKTCRPDQVALGQRAQDAKVTLIGINPLRFVADWAQYRHRWALCHRRFAPAASGTYCGSAAQREHALNIEFRQRDSFISEARGSFLTAQALCYECARKEGVVETERRRRTLVAAPGITRSIGCSNTWPNASMRDCVTLPRLMRCHHRGAALALLWMLHESSEKSVSLAAASQRFPVLREAIEWLQKGKLQQRFEQTGHLRELFYWNREGRFCR